MSVNAFCICVMILLNLCSIGDRGGGGANKLYFSYSPVTFKNVGINFLTFRFKLFAVLVEKYKAIPSFSPK